MGDRLDSVGKHLRRGRPSIPLRSPLHEHFSNAGRFRPIFEALHHGSELGFSRVRVNDHLRDERRVEGESPEVKHRFRGGSWRSRSVDLHRARDRLNIARGRSFALAPARPESRSPSMRRGPRALRCTSPHRVSCRTSRRDRLRRVRSALPRREPFRVARHSDRRSRSARGSLPRGEDSTRCGFLFRSPRDALRTRRLRTSSSRSATWDTSDQPASPS